jgi:hypothetical protein
VRAVIFMVVDEATLRGIFLFDRNGIEIMTLN